MTISENEIEEEDYSLGKQVKSSWIADQFEPKGSNAKQQKCWTSETTVLETFSWHKSLIEYYPSCE